MNQKEDLHWSKFKERGSMLGIEVLVFIHKYLGNWVFKVILFPIMIYFYLSGNVARKSIHHYLKNINQHQHNVTLTQGQLFRKGFRVFYNFGLAIVDKFDAWLGKVSIDDIDIVNKEAYQSSANAYQATFHKGVSRLGDWLYQPSKQKSEANALARKLRV